MIIKIHVIPDGLILITTGQTTENSQSSRITMSPITNYASMGEAPNWCYYWQAETYDEFSKMIAGSGNILFFNEVNSHATAAEATASLLFRLPAYLPYGNPMASCQSHFNSQPK